MRMHLTILTTLLTVSTSAFGGSLAVRLSPSEQQISHGETPRFSVTVESVSSPTKIMRFETRADLKDAYVRLVFTKDRREVDLPAAISDPGPVGDKDYFVLVPGRKFRFMHDGSPLALSELPVGTYSVSVKLQPDWSAKPVKSNSVSLQVIKHGS